MNLGASSPRPDKEVTPFSLDLIGIEKVSSVDYLKTVMACYRDGRIAVPVDSGAAAPPGQRFAEQMNPGRGGGWFAERQAPIDDNRPAQVSFSSGTTSEPKAILLSHRALADVTQRLTDVMQIDSEIREYLGVPATYSFGLARARVCAAAGGRLYVPENGFNPSELVRLLEADEVNALSAVPTLLRVLIANPDLMPKKVGRRLRWLEIGSQPMSVEEKQAIRRMFPAARIIQHYGLTEASRSTFLDVQEASDAELASVGKPIGRTEIKIDTEGRIAIRGPHIADGILTDRGLEPITGPDGWLHTNDLGHMDDGGFLLFDGRADFLMNVGGVKVPGELFEQRLAARLGSDAEHVAVAARPDGMRGEIVMVAHLSEVPASSLTNHVRETADEFGLGLGDIAIIEVPHIPRTDTGKVQRRSLGESQGIERSIAADAPGGGTIPARQPDSHGELSEREREVAAIWRDTLGIEDVGRDHSFFDAGGDSLSAISVMLKMERAGIPKEITQLIFEGRTVAEIAETLEHGAPNVAQEAVRRAEASDAITMTRGLLVGVVVAGHWSPFIFLRMGILGTALMKWLMPLFRLGTPGFAMVFGMGMAFFTLPMAKRHPERLRKNTRTMALLLAGGVAAVGAGRAASLALTPGGFDKIWISRVLYSVLAAYLLLVLTSPIIVRFFANRKRTIVIALITAFVSLSLAQFLRELFGNSSTTGAVDLVRLLASAKYGYAEMLGYTMSGFAVGAWIDHQHEDADLSAKAVWIGLAIFAGSATLTTILNMWPTWLVGSVSAPTLIAYLGIVMMLFGGLLSAIQRGAMRGRFKVPLRILAGIGTLAFLIYVGQELVMSLNDFLMEAGVSRTLSLGLLLMMFFGGIGLLLRRIYRLYYG